MSPPREDPIPNQDKNNLGLQKYQWLPPQVPPFYPGFKSLRNKANYDNPETKDTSRTDKDDTSRTNWDDSIEIHRFHRLQDKSLRTQFHRTMSHVSFKYENIVL